MGLWRSQVAHRTLNPAVEGPNPSRPAPLVVLLLVPSVTEGRKMAEYESEPLELFLYAMKSDATKDRYKRRMRNFFDFLELQGNLAEQAKQFISKSKKNGNSWVTANVMRFLSFHKERVERGEIAEYVRRSIKEFIKRINDNEKRNEIIGKLDDNMLL